MLKTWLGLMTGLKTQRNMNSTTHETIFSIFKVVGSHLSLSLSCVALKPQTSKKG